MFQPVQKRCYGFGEKSKLYNVAKGNVDFVQRLKLERKLEAHTGCVNTICWNSTGQKILSGSDDQHLVIMDPYTQKKLVSLRSGHRANIFSAKFMPASDDKQIVSCSGDGKIFYTNLERPQEHASNMFDCHFGTTYEVIVVPNEASTFLSCGEDGTVRWFDLRVKSSCIKESCKEDVLINCRRAVTSLAVNPFLPYHLAIACSDSSVRIFDRRMLGTRSSGNYTGRGITGMMCRFSAPTLAGRSYRITSLAYSPDGEDILVSYSSEYIYLFGHKENTVKTLGHTMPATQKPSNRVTTLDDLPVKLTESKPAKEPTRPVRPPPQPQSTSQGASASSLMESMPGHPPIKRLRLRGDWSDTGPNARPESERGTAGAADSAGEEQRRNPHASIMQRMSDMLTRWLDGNLRRGDERPTDQGEGQQPNDDNVRDAELEEVVTARQSAADDTGGTAEAGGGTQDSEDKSSEGNKSPRTKSEVMDISDSEDQVESQMNESDEPGQSCSSSALHTYIPSSSAINNSSLSVACSSTTSSSVIDNSMPSSSSACTSSSAVSSTTVSSPGVNSASSSSSSVGSSTASSSAVSSTTTSSSGMNSASTSSSAPSSTTDPSSAVGSSTSTEDTVCSEHRHPEPVREQNDELVTSHLPQGDSTASVEASSSNNSENTNQADEQSERLADGVEEAQGERGEDRPLEPVISLHYSSEGTTSSTIRLGFARFENLEAGLLQRSAEDASLAPLVREATPHNPEQEESPSLTQEGSQADEPSQESVLTEIAGGSKNEEKCESDIHFKNSSDKKTESETDLCDNVQSDSSNLEIESPICCGGEFSSEEKGDSDCNEEASLRGDNPSKETSDHQQTVADRASDLMGSATAGDATGDGRQEDNPENDTTSEARANPEQRGTSQRQRRIGRSGPPTGNYQPSGDEDTSDEEGGSSRRGRDGHDTLERHITAIRLQELYRKRQEEREKEEMELRNIHQPTFKIKYKGHRNARTMIKEANFWGNQFVMSGSDCGHIFIWDRYTAKLVMLLEGDRHVVNCLQPHPYDPMLASSGIDYDIKIWSPMAEKTYFDEESANEIIRRNEVMLEETRDTITVPAAFMLRVLASLNQLRSGRSANNSENPADQESDSDD